MGLINSRTGFVVEGLGAKANHLPMPHSYLAGCHLIDPWLVMMLGWCQPSWVQCEDPRISVIKVIPLSHNLSLLHASQAKG